jgi:tRNA (mo5U34)-methyltransferase
MQRDREPAIDRAEAERLVAQHPWWYHRFEIYPGVVTPGVYDPSGLLAALKLPADLTGKTILELGPADGYFTKQLDMRGADVTAMDYCAKDLYGFALMERLHGRPLRYVHANLFDLDRQGFTPFDYVLCSGVLYHLPDMLRALWAIRAYVKSELLLETLVTRKHEDGPFAEYLPATSCNNDPTNFWAPNPLCVQEMLRDCGFTVTETILFDSRGFFRATLNPSPDAGGKMRMAYSIRRP